MSEYIGSQNDRRTKMKSRMFRGYRAPMGVTEFHEMVTKIISTTYTGDGDVDVLVQEVEFGDGTKARKTTDFTYTAPGRISSTTVTYEYL